METAGGARSPLAECTREIDCVEKSRANRYTIPPSPVKIVLMFFGNSQPELLPGAKNAVETCLAVRPGEHVALIADETSSAVAASLSEALAQTHARTTSLLLEDFGPRPLRGAPEPVLDVLETADVGILAMNPLPGELAARMAIVQVVERRRIRYAH